MNKLKFKEQSLGFWIALPITLLTVGFTGFFALIMTFNGIVGHNDELGGLFVALAMFLVPICVALCVASAALEFGIYKHLGLALLVGAIGVPLQYGLWIRYWLKDTTAFDSTLLVSATFALVGVIGIVYVYEYILIKKKRA